MDTELARKLLGVDGSNLLMLETAWHHRRTQILEQQAQAGSEAEAAEQQALLDNLDLARAILKQAAEKTSRERPTPDRPPFRLAISATWRGVIIGVIIGVPLGAVVALAIVVLIVRLAGS